MQLKSTNNKRVLYLFFQYSLLFVPVALLCHFSFFKYGKSFFLTYDSFSQPISALTYFGSYTRTILRTFFLEKRLVIPEFDFSMGLGSDIVTSIHYYALGDPLSLLAVFFKAEHTAKLFVFLIFFRMYLAGVAFIIFCKSKKIDDYSALCTSFIYVFCGYTLYVATKHTYFINPMIYLPLLCLGIDHILEGKSFLPFACITFVSCASNFYFFYMLTALTVLYATVRFLFTYTGKERACFPHIFYRTVVGYILGVGMAAFLFLPNVYGFLQCGRADEEAERITFIYPLKYYVKMVLGFVSPATFGSYSTLGFAASVVPMMTFLFTAKNKDFRETKAFLSIGTIMLLLPAFGWALNGFSYVTNRWCFGYAFAISFCVAKIIPSVLNASFARMKLPLMLSSGIAILVITVSFVSKKVFAQDFICYLLLLLTSIILAVCYLKKINLKIPLLLATLCSVVANANVRFSQNGLNYLKECVSSEEYKKINGEFFADFPISQNDFFRVETALLMNPNASIIKGLKGTCYYWSIANGFLSDFIHEHELGSNRIEMHGLQGNRDLLSLLNVRYILYNENQENEINFLPNYFKQDTVRPGAYGVSPDPNLFSNTGKQYLGYAIYEYKDFVPFGAAEDGRHLLNVKIENNGLTAISDFEKSERIFISIPYSKFWKAEIDGEKTEIKISHTAFMEIEVPAEYHEISLHYKNQYLHIGFFVSIISFILFICIAIYKVHHSSQLLFNS